MSTFGGEALPGNGAGYYALGLAALIPGYLGYGRREGRRNADRELRRYIVGRMGRLKGILAEQPAAGERDATLDALRRLDDLQKRVEEAGTGLESFFNAGDMSEVDADEIHAYDRRIIDHLDQMEAEAASGRAGEWGSHLDRLSELVDERARAIERAGT